MNITSSIKSTLPLLMVIYCIFGIIPILQYTYLNQEPFLFAIKYTGPLIFLILVIESKENIQKNGALISTIIVFQVLAKSVFLSIMTAGYLLLINDFGGDKKEICLTGTIIKRWTNNESNIVTDYNFTLFDNSQNTNHSLNVSKKDYVTHDEGSQFTQCFKVGMLGIYYQ